MQKGKVYTVTMISREAGEIVETDHYGCRLTDIEWPVAQFERGGQEFIVNLSSPNFVKAERRE